jgi:hypothetical protein
MNLACPVVEARVEGDELVLKIEGFCGDLVVWDSAESAGIVSSRVNQPGWDPRTVCSESIRYRINRPITDIRVRSLAGDHELAWINTEKEAAPTGS